MTINLGNKKILEMTNLKNFTRAKYYYRTNKKKISLSNSYLPIKYDFYQFDRLNIFFFFFNT